MAETVDRIVFAANLRRLCATETSIADVCRDTGINRQQFNKYLAGRALPSVRIMRKICLRLGVSEDTLLRKAGEGDERPGRLHAGTSARAHQLGKELDRIFGLFLPENRSITRLADLEFKVGAYHTYFPLADTPGHVLRGYMEVWWHKDTMMFTRMTRVNVPGSRGLMLRSRHFGVVIESKGEISLVGRSRMSPWQVSVMNIQPDMTLHRFFLGLTLTHAAGPPMACRVILDSLGNNPARRLSLKPCGALPIDDPSVPEFVQQAMRPDTQRGPTLELPNVNSIIGSRLLRP